MQCLTNPDTQKHYYTAAQLTSTALSANTALLTMQTHLQGLAWNWTFNLRSMIGQNNSGCAQENSCSTAKSCSSSFGRLLN